MQCKIDINFIFCFPEMIFSFSFFCFSFPYVALPRRAYLAGSCGPVRSICPPQHANFAACSMHAANFAARVSGVPSRSTATVSTERRSDQVCGVPAPEFCSAGLCRWGQAGRVQCSSCCKMVHEEPRGGGASFFGWHAIDLCCVLPLCFLFKGFLDPLAAQVFPTPACSAKVATPPSIARIPGSDTAAFS
jgi:hypothetical protein